MTKLEMELETRNVERKVFEILFDLLNAKAFHMIGFQRDMGEGTVDLVLQRYEGDTPYAIHCGCPDISVSYLIQLICEQLMDEGEQNDKA